MTNSLNTIAYRAGLLGRFEGYVDNAKIVLSRWSKLHSEVKTIALGVELSELLLSARLLGLVTAVEVLLNDVLFDVFVSYPFKLGNRQISIQDLNSSGSFLPSFKRISSVVVNDLSYRSFKDYLEEWQKFVSPLQSIKEEQVKSFIEIKATRDLYVHSNGKLNDIYTRKAGEKARRPNSKGKIPLDESYIHYASGLAEDIIISIEREILSKYAHCTKEAVFREMWNATCCGERLNFDVQWEITNKPYYKKDISWPWSSSEKALFDFFLKVFHGSSTEITTDIEYSLYRWSADTAEGKVIRSWLDNPFYI
ncbi:MAG: hypothetical protein HGB00_08990 [Chlorobiaceae bacterium]|nr:hypothetical protein [Chlorobiaceae bacterium]